MWGLDFRASILVLKEAVWDRMYLWRVLRLSVSGFLYVFKAYELKRIGKAKRALYRQYHYRGAVMNASLSLCLLAKP